MIDVPAARPLAIADTEPMETMLPALLLHVPPAGVPDNTVLLPAQIIDEPVILSGGAFTVATLVA